MPHLNEIIKAKETFEKEMVCLASGKGGIFSYEKAMQVAIEVMRNKIEELSLTDDDKLITKWTLVEEQLPDDGTYLCILDGELCNIDEPFTGICGIKNGVWDEKDCVLAWMPMPKPYLLVKCDKRCRIDITSCNKWDTNKCKFYLSLKRRFNLERMKGV